MVLDQNRTATPAHPTGTGTLISDATSTGTPDVSTGAVTGMETVTGRSGTQGSPPDPELDAAGVDVRARLEVVSKRFAWDGKRLVVTHEPTLTRLTKRTMSASTMHAMDG